MQTMPEAQYAVQLVGPGQLRLVKDKSVPLPTGYQILAKVEAVGLCFSDSKLIKTFSAHTRKTPIVAAMDPAELATIPSYVPEDKPTVPGHECVVRIVAVGDKVRNHQVGERRLVQADYRDWRTAGGSNAAFGYNFEGGLQEYVLIDERVSTDSATGESYLISVGEEQSASAICLVEPYACVEESYACIERRAIKAGGRLLVIAEENRRIDGLVEAFDPEGMPARVIAVGADREVLDTLGVPVEFIDNVEELGSVRFDDIVYFGAQASTIEALGKMLAPNGLINVVTGGQQIAQPVQIDVGRIHYENTRWIGSSTTRACHSYAMIPQSKEPNDGEICLVIGAGGPMGQMHVIRLLSSEATGIQIAAVDMDDERLQALEQMAAPLARQRQAILRTINTKRTPMKVTASYVVCLVPSAALIAEAVITCANDCRVNIFAGIPADSMQAIDLNALIAKRCYLFGTSGSDLRDMQIVLEKIESGALDTDCSVAAVSGIAGAIKGIQAIENRSLSGKIIVYPFLHELGMIPLKAIGDSFPTVQPLLKNGQWTREAEAEFLRVNLCS